ncbi:MAG: PAS domain S-box protein [Verrucomicrobiaceae bacterium]|nr:MAG: PAS domain S-box protein [Verrucomicrobiaceae bacterium]
MVRGKEYASYHPTVMPGTESHQDGVALQRIRRVHILASAFVFALGTLVLTGWVLGFERLHTPFAAFRGMSASTAASLCLAMLALYLRQARENSLAQFAGRACGVIIILASAFSAGTWLLYGNTHLQTQPLQGESMFAGVFRLDLQLALDTTWTLAMLGCALFALQKKTPRSAVVTEWLAIASGCLPLAALVGYLYRAEEFFKPVRESALPGMMAPHTALGLLGVAVAILTATPESGWMQRFVSTRPAGIVARKSLPVGVLAILLLGGLSVLGEHLGFYSQNEGVALVVALSAVMFFLLLQYTTSAISTLDRSIQNTEENLRKSEEHLRLAIEAAHVSTWEWDIRTNEVRMSGVLGGLFGHDKAIFNGSGETFVKSIHPDDRDLVQTKAFRAIEGTEAYQVEYRVIGPDEAVRWVSSQGEVIRDQNGQPLRITGTSTDITERRLMERELIETSNREQRRLGQDLHDDLGQWLTAIHLETRALAMRLQSRCEPEAADAERIVAQIREALERTRMLARGMTPAVIESGGLAAALQELATSTERMFRARCDCFCSDAVIVRNPEAALQLYRIAQEAISNALRHGNATGIVITLEPKPGGRGCLCVHGNGSSIALPLPRGPGLGLHIMRYRAGLIGATLDIRPGAEGGTEVVCEFSSEL